MMDPTGRAERRIPAAAGAGLVVPLELSRADAAARQAPRQPIVRIHLLGTMRATTYLGQGILPRGRKARALLGILALARGDAVSRARLAGLLWDRVPDHQARTSFRQALRELSAAMGALADELIGGDRDSVRLDADLCWVDALAMLSPEPLPAPSLRGDLASLCSGDLLEGLDGVSVSFDHWLLAERTRFADRLRALLEAELLQLDQAGGDARHRAATARRVIAFEPTHERASRVLMRALADLGERGQALREFERCRDALRSCLDVEPSQETRALHQALRTFTGGRDDTAEPAVAPEPPRERPRLRPVTTVCDRLRVGVMPLRAVRRTCGDDLVASLSQEIAAALARFRWFDVIAPMSLTARPSAIDETMFRHKQLHYVVDGEVSGNDDRFQVSVQLLDVSQDVRPVWSDRFALTRDAIERVNEVIVAPVVARIDPVILFIEGQKPQPRRSGATALVLRAVPLMFSMERDKYEEAGRLIERALDIDPDNAKAAAWGAFWRVFYVGQGWARDHAAAFVTAQDLAVRAIRLDPENAEALAIYGHLCAFLDKDFDSAMHYFDRASRVNPNLAFMWAMSAPTWCYVGEPDLALARLDRYRDLAPLDPIFPLWEYFYAVAYVFKGDYEQAVSIGRRAAKANPSFVNGYKPLIAALGHLGRREEAAPFVAKLLALEPGFTVETFGRAYPFRRPADRERYMRGLLLAGVPAA